MKKTNFFRIVLSLFIFLSVFCVNVLAAEYPVSVVSADGTEAGYNTLYEATEAAKDGDTIYLNEDIEMGFFELNGIRTVPTMNVEGKDIILDGNGHTVTAKNEAFSMIKVEETGKITVKNITLDGSGASNRDNSNIINVEGGYAVMEDNAYLQNNATNAVGVGTNVPGGTFEMNGGEIRNNVVKTGGTDTGAAITVLTDSTFIMNGGKIFGNQSSTGASGIMVNRGGKAIINGGEIYNNKTTCKSMGSAIHIKGGDVEINDVELHDNVSGGYGAIYVTNHQSFERKWDGILTINGGIIYNNEGTSIYLWSKGNIDGTAAYIRFSGSPDIYDNLYVIANGFSNLDFKPLEVIGEFTPKQPVTLSLGYDYIVGQTVVDYAEPEVCSSEDFISRYLTYGYQEDKDTNTLYVELKREVIFMDGDEELTDSSYYEFVEEKVAKPEINKPGYELVGWYSDAQLQNEWNFETDTLSRDGWDDPQYLYAKWELLPALLELGEDKTINLPCDQEEYSIAHDFTKDEDHEYTYEWKDENGNVVSSEEKAVIDSLGNGETAKFTLTVTATRKDNGETATDSVNYTLIKGEHDNEWVIDKEPTYESDGYKHEECTICGHQKEQVKIPMLEKEESEIVVPETGDNSNLIYISLGSAISCALAIVVVLKKKQNLGK